MSLDVVITIACSDETDADWLRNKCVPAVEEVVEDQKEEKRLDGDVEVSWEINEPA